VVKIGIGAGKDGPPRTQARRERTNQPRSPLITQTQDAVPRHRSATTPPSPKPRPTRPPLPPNPEP
jgi:hypothetical protein